MCVCVCVCVPFTLVSVSLFGIGAFPARPKHCAGDTSGMAEQTPDLGLARDEALARLWRAAAQGLPIPSECFAHSPSSDLVRKLQLVAAWNNHGSTAVALCAQTPDDNDLTKAQILAKALFHGSVDAAAALIAARADMHTVVDLGGGSALHCAVHGGHPSAVAFLINAKANVGYVGFALDTAIHSVTKGGDAVVEMLLVAKVDVNRADSRGTTPMHDAASAGDAAIVLRLLQAKANVNATDNVCETALHQGARHAPVVRVLLAAKANVHAADHIGRRAVWFAACSEQAGSMARLIRAKADVHAVDLSGNTALHIAASVGKHVAVAAFLIAAKLDVNRANRAGTTPLCVALARNAEGPIVQLLLDAKARVDA